MKRNLFAMFLAVALVVALVFVVAPSAKAESYTFTETDREFSISKDSILDMAGFSGKVTLSNGAKLTVYDSGNTSKTGENVAQLTVEGDGSVEKITLQNGYRYLKVENTNGTYSFHPFNMAFTHIGLNTKTNSVCVRVAFIANNVVKAKLTDYGIYSTVHEEYASCAEKYPFNNANGVYAYYDFVDSFGEEDIDSTKSVKLYMTVDGETVETDYTASFIPREVLKKINKVGPTIANEPQLDRITDMIDGNDRISNILTNFRAEAGNASLSFADKAQRTEYSTTKQVWEQNGIKLTNNKSSSTNNVGDYANPGRFYKSSQIIIESAGMTKIVLNCVSSYATTGLATTTDHTVSTSGTTTTITFNSPVDSFKFTAASQIRMNSITVYANFPADCQHHGGTASCTEKAVCIDCDNAYGDYAHSYSEETGYCDCGAANPAYTFSTTITEALKLPDGINVIVSGTVVEIVEEYSSSYNNISVRISDDAGNKLYLYRLSGNVSLGDIITVTGQMATYSNARQVAAGATFVKTGEHACSDFTELSCTVASTCTFCKKVHTVAPGHTDTNPADHNCDACETVISSCADDDGDTFCDICGNAMGDAPAEPVVELLATFSLGANGSVSHYDGSEKSSYSETVNGHTLSITGGSKMYTGARDAKGNSCIKLGTGSAAGKFTITVPENVTEVVIYVAKYKSNTAKITVNSASYTLSSASNNGAYDAITVDTSSTKTISFTTVSGGYRAMVNTIVFNGYAQ